MMIYNAKNVCRQAGIDRHTYVYVYCTSQFPILLFFDFGMLSDICLEFIVIQCNRGKHEIEYIPNDLFTLIR